MTDVAPANAFLAGIPTFATFAEIADPSRYAPLPEDWTVCLSDVSGSTRAIEAGQFKSVSWAGAAVISAVTNALGHGGFPFVFGGDGASLAVPPPWLEAAREAIAATATFVDEELGLDLRIGAVSVAAIREAGRDVRLARFAASPQVAYAMFSGGGLAWAEEQLKAGAHAIPRAPPGSRPDLLGLSCRFEEMPARRGVILSLIVRPGSGGDSEAFQDLIRDLLARIEQSSGMARPVPESGPAVGFPPSGLDLEVRAQHRPGPSRPFGRLRLLARAAGAAAVLRFRIPVGRFRPVSYIKDLVANSDYRKYDDGLRMTIDCAPALADAIEARLVRAAADGVAVHGLHRQGAALMTCFTPSVQRRDHIHFVDGAAGGYAAAAAGLKAEL